jgi:hypothetical protein
MINTAVNNNSEQKPEKIQQESMPNEHGGFYFSTALKITDPETGEVLVQQRAD